jgi:hypothetical protein
MPTGVPHRTAPNGRIQLVRLIFVSCVKILPTGGQQRARSAKLITSRQILFTERYGVLPFGC